MRETAVKIRKKFRDAPWMGAAYPTSAAPSLHEPERRALFGRRGAMLRAPARFMAPRRVQKWRWRFSMNNRFRRAEFHEAHTSRIWGLVELVPPSAGSAWW